MTDDLFRTGGPGLFARRGVVEGHHWEITILPKDQHAWPEHARLCGPAMRWAIHILFRDGDTQDGYAPTVGQLRDEMLPFAVQEWTRRTTPPPEGFPQ